MKLESLAVLALRLDRVIILASQRPNGALQLLIQENDPIRIVVIGL